MQMMGPMLTNHMEVVMRVTLASLLITQGRHDEADPHLQAALPLSRNLLGLMDGQILGLFGQVREHQGRIDEARTFYQEAIDAVQGSGDEAGRKKLLERLKATERDSEPVPEARPPEEPKSGDRMQQARLLLEQGEVARRVGSYQEAEARINEALALLEGLGATRAEVVALRARAMSLRAQNNILLGDLQEAIEDATASQAAADIGDPILQSMNRYLEQLSRRLANQPNQLEEAADSLSEAFEDSGIPAGTVLALPQVLHGDEENMLLALSMLEKMGGAPPPWDRILRPMVLAQRAIHEERFEDAVRALDQMHGEIRRQGLPDLEIWVLTQLAALQWRLGRPETSLEWARKAVAMVESLQGGLGDASALGHFHGSERRWVYQIARHMPRRCVRRSLRRRGDRTGAILTTGQRSR